MSANSPRRRCLSRRATTISLTSTRAPSSTASRRYGKLDPLVIGAITIEPGRADRNDKGRILRLLPIDSYLSDIVAHARERRAVVVTAAPGAGKSTRVPPALTDHGSVILLQPRRVAARAIARRIASER